MWIMEVTKMVKYELVLIPKKVKKITKKPMVACR